MDSPLPRLVSRKELASILRVSLDAIDTLAHRGELPYYKVGRSWRFDLDRVLKALEARRP